MARAVWASLSVLDDNLSQPLGSLPERVLHARPFTGVAGAGAAGRAPKARAILATGAVAAVSHEAADQKPARSLDRLFGRLIGRQELVSSKGGERNLAYQLLRATPAAQHAHQVHQLGIEIIPNLLLGWVFAEAHAPRPTERFDIPMMRPEMGDNPGRGHPLATVPSQDGAGALAGHQAATSARSSAISFSTSSVAHSVRRRATRGSIASTIAGTNLLGHASRRRARRSSGSSSESG